ncbi:biotin transporter BioY [Desulfococcus sp.]|uniref:biotin transporter BioY n=1 Tax=Desulfococcus sp. TaxID=2025834 RepID=UPI003593EC9C
MNPTPLSAACLHQTVYASLFAALIAAGAFLAIPIGPVPIVLQNLFVLLTGLLLGPRWGLASVGIYLLAGAIGLPVFAGGTGGIGRILGPTGGYLVAYLPAVWVVGIVSARTKGRVMGDIAAMALGALIVYGMGVPHLKAVTGMPWSKAVAAGMLPFLIGDALKIAAAVPIARTLRPVMAGRVQAFRSDEYSRG